MTSLCEIGCLFERPLTVRARLLNVCCCCGCNQTLNYCFCCTDLLRLVERFQLRLSYFVINYGTRMHYKKSWCQCVPVVSWGRCVPVVIWVSVYLGLSGVRVYLWLSGVSVYLWLSGVSVYLWLYGVSVYLWFLFRVQHAQRAHEAVPQLGVQRALQRPQRAVEAALRGEAGGVLVQYCF